MRRLQPVRKPASPLIPAFVLEATASQDAARGRIDKRSSGMSHRRGTALTVLVVVVLAAATAGLTVAATSIVTARTEQLRQGRASDIQRMLDAGRQWVQAGGLNTAANPAAETITLQLPSFAGPADGSSLPGIEKQVEIKVEPDNQIRMTAKLQRVRGDTPLVFATRTIRFVPQPEGEN